MKKNLSYILSVLTFSVLLTISVVAQDVEREKQIVSAAGDVYVISAKAGGVNFVEGNVSVARNEGKSGALLKQDSLGIGDRVTTGANGKAEILLNPGSFLRLGANSEFEFTTTDLESLKLKLIRGSVICEVYASDEFKVEVQTPKNKVYLIESGIYRIDLNGANEAVSVWKGRAQIGDDLANTITKGKRGISANGQISLVKFDRGNRDSFDNWSKLRAKNIAEANKRLQDRALNQSLLESYRRQGWGFYESFGLWVYNPFYGTYCFLPFGNGWRSPYGHGYGYSAWDYHNYSWYPHNWGNRPNNPPPSTTPTPTGNPPPSAANLERAERLRTPPFQRMPESENRGGSSSSDSSSTSSPNYDSSSRSNSSSSDSKPSYSPSSDTKTYSPPPPSSPPSSENSNSDTKGRP